MNIELRKKLVRSYLWIIFLFGSEIWTLIKLERKHLDNFEMWCWRRMKKTKWSKKVTNEVLERTGNKRTLLNNTLRRKAYWIGHILRRNFLLHYVIEGRITEVK